jgi:uncharacterized membrane protein YdbT with pleckstrin-like domain
MSYVRHVIQPGEEILRVGHLHWIIFREAIVLAGLAIAVFVFGYENYSYRPYAVIAGGVLLAGALFFFLRASFRRAITEIAVTNKRIIRKVGFINRRTEEMNIDKVETVVVDQSIFGRLLDYGTITIKGTGQSLEDLDEIASPIDLRNAIETH